MNLDEVSESYETGPEKCFIPGRRWWWDRGILKKFATKNRRSDDQRECVALKIAANS